METLSNYNNINISKVCRICLTEKRETKFIAEEGLSEILIECASLELTEDHRSLLICNECVSDLRKWFAFKQKVLKAFKIGQQLVAQAKQAANEPPVVQTVHLLEPQANDFVEISEVQEMNVEVKSFEQLICEHCGKQFSTSTYLKKHLKLKI